MSNEEYYSIPRSILESSPNTQKVYFFFLLNEGFEGTFADLARKLRLSRQELRTALKNIDKQPMPNQSLTNAQPTNTPIPQEVTGGLQPMPNQSLTKGQPILAFLEEKKKTQTKENREEIEERISPTKKNPLIEGKKKVPLEERRAAFYESLIPYVEEFGKAMVREFYDYWSEPYQNIDKFRMEGEKTWDTHRRLLTWQKRDEAARLRSNGLAIGQVLHNNKNKEYEGW